MRTAASVLFCLSLALVPAARTAHAEDVDPLAELAITLQEQVADIMDRDRSDCDKLAVDVVAYLDGHKREFAAVSEWAKRLTTAQKRAYVTKYGPRLQAASVKSAASTQACLKNTNVFDAMKRLDNASK